MSSRARLILLLGLAVACAVLVYWLARSGGQAEDQGQRIAARSDAQRPEIKPTLAQRPPLELPASTYTGGGASEGQVLVNGSWGAGAGQFGRRQAQESNPEGPMSLRVDSKGGVWILDQVNRRVQRFDAAGKALPPLSISGTTAQDLALTDDGRALVLDRLGPEPGVAVYDGEGRHMGRLDVVGGKVKEGGGITGVFAASGGTYVEDGHDDLVQVADADGKQSDLTETIPGRPTRDGKLYIKAGVIDKAAGRVYVQAHTLQKKLAWELPLNLTRPVLHLLLLDSDHKGRVYLGAEVGIEDPATHAMTDLATVVVRITAEGKLDGTLILPPSTADAAETFRPLVVGGDGTIYHMVASASGLKVTSYTF